MITYWKTGDNGGTCIKINFIYEDEDLWYKVHMGNKDDDFEPLEISRDEFVRICKDFNLLTFHRLQDQKEIPGCSSQIDPV